MRIVIVGAGPAGMAAAIRASECGEQVLVLDDNPGAGGQIWRNEHSESSDRDAAAWFRLFERAVRSHKVELAAGARVVAANARERTLLVDEGTNSHTLPYKQLILATGARERFLPFPGWTLPNVMGVGGLQALVKSGLPVSGKRIVVAGTGPLLLAVAAYLRKHGAVVPLIAEQCSLAALTRFSRSLFPMPAKLVQAVRLQRDLIGTSYRTTCWVTRARGENRVQSVQLAQSGKQWDVECDYLAVAYGFHPSTELADHLGCQLADEGVRVDDSGRTSVDRVWCIGESTGLGGVDLSLVEGEIAGYAVAGRMDLAKRLFVKRRRAVRFAAALNKTFHLRDELRALPENKTIVCRCEDVSLEQIKSAHSWRSAKLYTRSGMGPCQGRICGPAVEFLLGWKAESVRLPVFPTRIESLLSHTNKQEEEISAQ